MRKRKRRAKRKIKQSKPKRKIKEVDGGIIDMSPKPLTVNDLISAPESRHEPVEQKLSDLLKKNLLLKSELFIKKEDGPDIIFKQALFEDGTDISGSLESSGIFDSVGDDERVVVISKSLLEKTIESLISLDQQVDRFTAAALGKAKPSLAKALSKVAVSTPTSRAINKKPRKIGKKRHVPKV